MILVKKEEKICLNNVGPFPALIEMYFCISEKHFNYKNIAIKTLRGKVVL